MTSRRSGQTRLASTSPNCSEVDRLEAGSPMSNPVDTPMLAKQSARRQPVLNLIGRDSCCEQLPPGDNPVIRSRNPSEYPLHCPVR